MIGITTPEGAQLRYERLSEILDELDANRPDHGTEGEAERWDADRMRYIMERIDLKNRFGCTDEAARIAQYRKD